jgi:hypothetical protein
VTGFAVALPHDTTRAGAPVWFGGGKLAADLTCPSSAAAGRPPAPGLVTGSLQQNGPRSGSMPRAPRRVLRSRSGTLRPPTREWPTPPGPRPTPRTPPRPRWAAGCSARPPTPTTAQPAPPFGRIPTPGQPGNNLRRTARQLSTLPSVAADVPLAKMTLLMRFARLAEAIAELREAQRLAAQAAAARRAAEHLRAAMPGYVTPPSGGRTRVRTTSADRSRAEFPFPPGAFRPGTGSPGKADDQRGARPVPSQRPSRPRGPTR